MGSRIKPPVRFTKRGCFSPPVMLATFLIEAVLAIYTAVRFPPSKFQNISIAILVCLASFQLAEYQVCQGAPAQALDWTKFGLIGISFLPALGMHLIGAVTRKSAIVPIGYLLAAAYSILFVFVPGATQQAQCCGNYVMLHITSSWIGWVYELYYALFVLLAMFEMAHRLMFDKGNEQRSSKLIGLVLFGYLAFTVPMAVIDAIFIRLRAATPSFLCGFAVLLAVVLAIFAMPAYAREVRHSERGEEHRRRAISQAQ